MAIDDPVLFDAGGRVLVAFLDKITLAVPLSPRNKLDDDGWDVVWFLRSTTQADPNGPIRPPHSSRRHNVLLRGRIVDDCPARVVLLVKSNPEAQHIVRAGFTHAWRRTHDHDSMHEFVAIAAVAVLDLQELLGRHQHPV